MEKLFENFLSELRLLIFNIPLVLYILAVLWVVHLVNWCCHYKLNRLGIIPRKAVGLIGIPCYSLLHKDFQHLIVNSLPLFVLMSFALLYGKQNFIHLTLFIALCGGAGVWLFARKGIHIGASVVAMGYFGFIIAIALLTRNILAIVVSAVCLFYLWSLLLGLIPTKERSSWEGHLMGFVFGVLFVFL